VINWKTRREVTSLRLRVLTVVVLVLLLIGIACSDSPAVSTAPVSPEPTAVSPSSQPAPPPIPQGLPDPITVAVASTDLAVGSNRVVFGLIRRGKGPLRDAEVNVETFLLEDSGPDGPRQIAPAAFQIWPEGAGGVYIANLTFDETGEWGLGFRLSFPDGSESQAGTRVQVKSTSATPALGTTAPRSQNKTSRDVGDLDELTTDLDPDPDLYAKTIAEALDEGIPLVISFATPAYCKTATCGPQLETLKRLKTSHSERINFIHVEVYDNPPEIRESGISVAKLSPTLAEWGLPTEPWTFVIDAEGLIRAKYEGFVSSAELEEAITSTLGGS
jgi:hypothetical protein